MTQKIEGFRDPDWHICSHLCGSNFINFKEKSSKNVGTADGRKLSVGISRRSQTIQYHSAVTQMRSQELSFVAFYRK